MIRNMSPIYANGVAAMAQSYRGNRFNYSVGDANNMFDPSGLDCMPCSTRA
jgi:hypothetical protein